MKAKKTSKKAEEPKAEKPKLDVMYRVRILQHRTKVGSCTCAKGAEISISKERADALVAAEMAEIIGV